MRYTFWTRQLFGCSSSSQVHTKVLTCAGRRRVQLKKQGKLLATNDSSDRCVWVLCLHVCARVSLLPRGQKRVADVLEKELGIIVSHRVGAGNQSPLQEQQMLLHPEPSLQPSGIFIRHTRINNICAFSVSIKLSNMQNHIQAPLPAKEL